MKIAFIGLGAMGRPMAEHLVAEGFDIRVSDANPALAEIFGAAWAANPAEAASGADVVVTMLPNGAIVEDVLLGSGDAAAALERGTVVVDMSSSGAAGTVALGAQLAARGIALVDAPVSGGVGLAGQGKLTVMAGFDDEAAYTKALPVLDALSARLMRVGGLGAGHAAKAINNAVAACVFAVTAEGLELGVRFGLEPASLLEVINNSTGRSGVSEGLFPSQVLTGRYALGFALALMTKDVGLADELRSDLSLNLPLLEATAGQYRTALATLGNSADFTEFHRFLQGSLGEGV